MRLAKRALLIALITMIVSVVASAQTLRPENDPRNIAPTIGTGGPTGGPTGLFTVYDAQTLRRKEYTFSVAYSNFDRDPGNVDITEIPISFQIGVNNRLELFFNTDAYRGIKVNSPANLSGFYLPNSQLLVNGALVSPAAVILSPRGPNSTGSINLLAIFRPQGNQPFVSFPFAGGSAGTFGLFGNNTVQFPLIGPLFGFPAGLPQLGIFRTAPNSGSHGGADLFPGVGSPYGGILPGIVWTTTPLICPAGIPTPPARQCGTAPVSFSVHPSYLPDAPFLNRRFGQTAFSTMTVGAKIRLNDENKSYGFALIPFYRFYVDKADDAGGFNQLQRGASPGGNFGDIGLVFAADARLARWANLSGNIGYIWNSNPKGTFPNGEFVLIDRPDEIQTAVGFDFPVNKHFQVIAELRSTNYFGGRTPNALENSPVDVLGGIRIFPRRWFGMSFGYRLHLNQQDEGSFDDGVNTTTTIQGAGANGTTATFTQIQNGRPVGLRTSDDPHGFFAQLFIGRRNERKPDILPNNPPAVNPSISDDKIRIANCPPGQKADCPSESTSIQVAANATDPDGDSLLYTYNVTGGRITGDGANVTWDLSGAAPGTYTVTVQVDDGCGCVTTQTKDITIENCNCITPCGTVSVSGASSVLEGTPTSFSANANYPDGVTVTYNWTVSAGRIVEGQGTPNITVDTTGFGGQPVTATVELGGVAPECPRTASASTDITQREIPKPQPRKDFDFESTNFNFDKAQLDIFATSLQDNQTATGLVVITAGSKSKRGEADKYARKTRDYLVTTRGISADRVKVVVVDSDGSSEKIRVQYWFIPAGASSDGLPTGRDPREEDE